MNRLLLVSALFCFVIIPVMKNWWIIGLLVILGTTMFFLFLVLNFSYSPLPKIGEDPDIIDVDLYRSIHKLPENDANAGPSGSS